MMFLKKKKRVGGFTYILHVHPRLGIDFLTSICFKWVETKPPTRKMPPLRSAGWQCCRSSGIDDVY